MMARTQITLESYTHKRARQRASELGVSLAEYVRRLVARDLAKPQAEVKVTLLFDLGSSGQSDISRNKDLMIAESFHSASKKARRHAIGQR